MNARRVLFTDAGVLRAPWRIFLFLLITLVATQVCAVLVGPLLEWVFAATGGLRGVNTAPWIECGALLIATAISLRWIDKRPWSYVWLGREAANPRPIAFGFAIGAAAIGLPIALLLSAHWLRDVRDADESPEDVGYEEADDGEGFRYERAIARQPRRF